MKITVDLSGLFGCAEEMGAELVKANLILPPDASSGLDRPEWVPIKKEIDLNDIENTQGLLSYTDERGVVQQVLLYIQDHGGGIESAIQDITKRRKFHVADCSTLQLMKEKGKFERYVITNDLSNQFFITGKSWSTEKKLSDTVELEVCKNCLSKLNYKNYKHEYAVFNDKVFHEFNIAEFFTTYSSLFSSLPSRFSGENDGDYSEDWPMISAKYRASKNYTCQSCKLDLSQYKKLLHTHHKNGVKTHNRESNLQALCIDCHRKQVNHEHLFVHHQDMVVINRLRREQGLLNKIPKPKSDKWATVFECADSALQGLLGKCQHAGIPVPIVAYELLGEFDQIIAELELAWPNSKQCIVINKGDAKVAKKQKWTSWSIIDALNNFDRFKAAVR